MYLFCAGVLLIREGERTASDDAADWIIEVEKCISYLDQVSSWNAIAEQALDILQQRLHSAVTATIQAV